MKYENQDGFVEKMDKKCGKSDNLYNLANVSLKNLW